MKKITKDNFEEMLEKTKEKSEEIIDKKEIDFSSGIDFENFIEKRFLEIIEEMDINSDLFTHHSSQKFPDFSVGRFGIEVKLSKKGWKSTGNSVYEGNRIDRVEKIYLFFLNEEEGTIRTKAYEDCLSDIKVTHSPRYHINMDQEKEEGVFAEENLDYKEFVERDYPTSTLKKYMRERYEGEETWFLDSEQEEMSATVKEWSDLGREKKKNLRAEIFALFPKEIFSSQFLSPVRYLLEEYQIICHNFRDIFTAGGRETIEVNGEYVEVPAVYDRLRKNSNKIREKLYQLDNSLLREEWHIPDEEEIEPEERWMKILEENTEREDAVAIYKSGLEKRLDEYS